MTDDLKQRLRELSASRKPYPTGAHGQMVGMESYRIVANGFALECVDEAADRIEQLEAECDELKAALHKQVAHDKAVSYERCLDCDWPNRCTRETGCLGIKDHSPIANACISKLKGQS